MHTPSVFGDLCSTHLLMQAACCQRQCPSAASIGALHSKFSYLEKVSNILHQQVQKSIAKYIQYVSTYQSEVGQKQWTINKLQKLQNMTKTSDQPTAANDLKIGALAEVVSFPS